jgi:hypothetical protein
VEGLVEDSFALYRKSTCQTVLALVQGGQVIVVALVAEVLTASLVGFVGSYLGLTMIDLFSPF